MQSQENVLMVQWSDDAEVAIDFFYVEGRNYDELAMSACHCQGRYLQ